MYHSISTHTRGADAFTSMFYYYYYLEIRRRTDEGENKPVDIQVILKARQSNGSSIPEEEIQ